MTDATGWQVARLLGGAFRTVTSELHDELARRGHPDARPAHGFALQAVGTEGCTVSELGQRLGVSKQAAAKTAGALETLGYLRRKGDAYDRRAVRLSRTARAEDLLRVTAEAFSRRIAAWEEQVGPRRLATTLAVLAEIGGDAKPGDLPGRLGN